jgi:hypothetical protein
MLKLRSVNHVSTSIRGCHKTFPWKKLKFEAILAIINSYYPSLHVLWNPSFHYFSVALSEMCSDRNKNSCTTNWDFSWWYQLLWIFTFQKLSFLAIEFLYTRQGAKCFTYITSFNPYYHAILEMKKWQFGFILHVRIIQNVTAETQVACQKAIPQF